MEPPDPGAFRALDLRGAELPVIIEWATGEAELEAAFGVRREVFVREQGYTEEQEFDPADDVALHALAHVVPTCATTPGASRDLGTARLLMHAPPEGSSAHEHVPTCTIGRVAVLPHARRMGVGTALVGFLAEAARGLDCRRVRAGVQLTALDFWERLGFLPTGETYMDFHIPHEWTVMEL